MKCRKVMVAFLYGFVLFYYSVHACMGDLSESENYLLNLIAESNRVNRKLLNSFDCQYALDMVMPEIGETHITETSRRSVRKTGRYAFSGNKVYSMDKVLGTEDFLHYVQNGPMRRMRVSPNSPPGLVVMGSTDESQIRPGTPDPWSIVDEGVSAQLDNLDEKKFGKVVSVETSKQGGHDMIKVVILTPTRVPDGTGSPYTVEMWYSEKDGYMPAKYRLEINEQPKWGGHTVGHGGTKEIRKYEFNGNTLFLPISYYEELYNNGKLSRTKKYSVDPNTVRINPDLPDALFQIEIRPDDQVINKDLGGLELQGPGGHEFLLELGSGANPFSEEDLLPAEESNSNEQQNSKSLRLCNERQLELAYIPSGEFVMGSPPSEIGYPERLLKNFRKKGLPSRPEEEGPTHKMKINKGFYLSKYEVTSAQYRCFRAKYERGLLNGKKIDLDDQPALVTWNEAFAFCKWLSEETDLHIRLPSEAEWEYACRAGTQTRFFWGDSDEEAGKYANIADKTFEAKMPGTAYYLKTLDGEFVSCSVGKYKPNEFGLFDMIGNASEWCQDLYYEDAYSSASQNDNNSRERVYRGGGWSSDIISARCASRRGSVPNDALLLIGFRIVLEDQ